MVENNDGRLTDKYEEEKRRFYTDLIMSRFRAIVIW